MRRYAALLLLAATLAGCAPIPTPLQAPAHTPSASPAPSEVAQAQLSAMLYFAGGNQITPVQRLITVPSGQSAAQAIVEELIRGPGDEAAALRPVMPGDARVLGVELTGNIVTVNIGSNEWDPIGLAASAHEEDYLTLCMALANTLIGLPGIHYVTVLINSYPLWYYFLPIGPMTSGSVDIDAEKYARENEGRRTRGVVQDHAIYAADTQLYFGDTSGQYLIPEVRAINYYQFDLMGYCSTILREILRGPDDRAALTRLLPNRPEWFTMTPALNASVNQTVILELSSELFEWFEEEGIDPVLAVGSLSLSLLTYCPDLVGVVCRFSQNMMDAWITRIAEPEGLSQPPSPSPSTPAATPADEVWNWHPMGRSDYASAVGASFLLYFPVSDHYLKSSMRAITIHHGQAELLLWLRELIKGPSREASESLGVRPAFPESALGMTDYIRDVVLDGNTAVVILDQGLISHCEGMTPEEERLMVYAMVNTLTERPDISWVRFILPDGTPPVFSGHIDLSGPLIRAPLLIRY